MLSRDYGLLPHALAEEMLAAEEAALMALYKQEPWGDQRLELAIAQVAQILWNANTSKEHRRKIFDFLPFYRKKIEVDEDVESKVKERFALLMGKGKQ